MSQAWRSCGFPPELEVEGLQILELFLRKTAPEVLIRYLGRHIADEFAVAARIVSQPIDMLRAIERHRLPCDLAVDIKKGFNTMLRFFSFAYPGFHAPLVELPGFVFGVFPVAVVAFHNFSQHMKIEIGAA